MKKTTHLLVITAFAAAIAQPSLLWAAASQAAPSPSAASAIKQFDDAIAKYITMRHGLRSEVRGPVKNSTSTQVEAATDALAASIQRARRRVQAGAIFTPPASVVIKRRIIDTVRSEHLVVALADIDDDGPTGAVPKVNLRLPQSAQMATMPSALLKVLPALPKELEYRIMGRYLVLRDTDANLIIDYIPLAVPR